MFGRCEDSLREGNVTESQVPECDWPNPDPVQLQSWKDMSRDAMPGYDFLGPGMSRGCTEPQQMSYMVGEEDTQLRRSDRAQQSLPLPALGSHRTVCISDGTHCSPPCIGSSSLSTVLSLPLQDELFAGQGSRPINAQWPTHSAISGLSRQQLGLALEIKHWSCCICVWDVKKTQHVSSREVGRCQNGSLSVAFVPVNSPESRIWSSS